MTRRKFMRITGTALAVAGLPMAARIGRADGATPPGNFGGPTPNKDFYVTSYGRVPTVDAAKWTLKIHGLVDKPLALTYDDILHLPQVTQTLTLECIGNRPNGTGISNAEWTGVMLRPLLERAGLGRKAVYAAIRGADGYSTGISVDEMMREENWMAFRMNGVPLPAEHGYPLRIFIPGKYGMKQPKWLTEIEFVDHEFIGYYEARGWSQECWRKVNSGFFSPQPKGGFLDIVLTQSAKVKAPVDIVGWALAGPSGVKRVEASTDNGATWSDAVLVENKSPYTWTVWKYHFAPKQAGEYSLRVRATDGAGHTQPERDPDSYFGQSAQPRMNLEVTSVA